MAGGTLYYFVVSAVNLDGESLNSAYVSAKPTAPAGPTGLTVVAGNAAATLAWTASARATGYVIKRATASTGPWTTAGTSTAPNFVATGLTNGTLFYFVVSFVADGGESLKLGGGQRQADRPGGPTGVTATAGEWSATVKWTAVSGAQSYNVKSSSSSTGPWTTAGTTTGTSLTVTQLPGNTLVYFVVTFVGADGESNNSTAVSAKPTAPPGPTGVTVAARRRIGDAEWAASARATCTT